MEQSGCGAIFMSYKHIFYTVYGGGIGSRVGGDLKKKGGEGGMHSTMPSLCAFPWI
jgi:hypothetical protein